MNTAIRIIQGIPGVEFTISAKKEIKLLLPPAVLFLMAVFVVYQFGLCYMEVSYSIYQYGG